MLSNQMIASTYNPLGQERQIIDQPLRLIEFQTNYQIRFDYSTLDNLMKLPRFCFYTSVDVLKQISVLSSKQNLSLNLFYLDDEGKTIISYSQIEIKNLDRK